MIEFEDGGLIHRRILIRERKIQLAEALAVKELYSFLQYHGFEKGIVLLDNKEAINWIILNKSKRLEGLHQCLASAEVELQYIPRRYNIAHSLAHSNRYVPSSNVKSINRDHLSAFMNFPEYNLNIEVYEEFRKLYPKKTRCYHKYQKALNKKIWLGNVIEEGKDYSVYAYYDLRIKVSNDNIVSVSKEQFVSLKNHYTVIRNKKKLSRVKRKVINTSSNSS
ncbi:hypothetical protein [Bacillus sp. Marseille-Q1617]|uniref:hypothetical protein n=1 Tax=Bacillus sp. Marseille-Q1617 TaxID=2736887 RepID=UPI00158C551B|nr:hypothetical protein [Bacillus sp. Marseille-Q1617]